jgi:hypothetical protein
MMNRASGFRYPASGLPDGKNLGPCKFISLSPTWSKAFLRITTAEGKPVKPASYN